MNYRVFLLLIICLFLTFSFAVLHGAEGAERGQSDNLTKEERIKNWLDRQDKDDDGKISRDEVIGLMKSNFTRNDTNRDDFLDRDELGQLADRLARGGEGLESDVFRGWRGYQWRFSPHLQAGEPKRWYEPKPDGSRESHTNTRFWKRVTPADRSLLACRKTLGSLS